VRRPRSRVGLTCGRLSYHAFGLFIYHTAQWWLSLRCGPLGQRGRGGHAHNDQLSLTLCAYGQPIIIDPGTYVYTPLPGERNRFRSTASHNVLHVPGREQNDWDDGLSALFRLKEKAFAKLIEDSDTCWIGEHQAYGVPCRRTVRLVNDQVVGLDECPLPGAAKELRFHLDPAVRATVLSPSRVRLEHGDVRVLLQHDDTGAWTIEPTTVSPGYGLRVPSLCVSCPTVAQRIGWTFSLESST
jgi:Heparinase II/III-like protein